MTSKKNFFSTYKNLLLIILCVLLFISGTSFCVYRFLLVPLTINYQTGISLLEQYSYEDALETFSHLGNYKDSAQKHKEIDSYLYADELIASENYITAIKLLNSIPNTEHVQRRLEQIYQIALNLKEDKNYEASLSIFLRLKDYKESRQLGNELIQLIDEHNKLSLASGYSHFAMLTATGEVHTTGDNSYGQCDTSDWSHISKIYVEGNYTIGITQTGDVVLAGDIAPEGQVISTWKNIKELILFPYPSLSKAIGLKNDGTIISTTPDSPICSWTNIDHLTYSNDHIIGLRSDGTLIATGSNSVGQCNISNWHEITQVIAGTGYTLGLTKSGTVLLAGDIASRGAINNWTNICYLWSSDTFTVGLQTDGSLIAAGSILHSNALSSWKNISQISLNNTGIIGLQLNHSLVSIGLTELTSFDQLNKIHIGKYQFGAVKCDDSLVTKELISPPTADDFKPRSEPLLGMLPNEVKASSWGMPQKIVTTIDTDGTHEEWIYGPNSIFLLNGVVISIRLEEAVDKK